MTNETLTLIRRLLLGLIAFGMGGTGVELLLLGHFESVYQLIPLGLIAISLLVIAWHHSDQGPSSIRVLRTVMMACIVAGVIGIGLHFWSNVEFEIEMYPNIEGMDLFKRAISGAMPALAPGSMIQ